MFAQAPVTTLDEKMSPEAVLFFIYFIVGLLLVIVAVATPGKERRAENFGPMGTGTGLDAWLLIFIALLWPIWLLTLLAKERRKD